MNRRMFSPVPFTSWLQLSDVKEILLIGFYQQTKEMARFILDMQKKHNLSIRYIACGYVYVQINVLISCSSQQR